jgi:putative DNA primase/helicase
MMTKNLVLSPKSPLPSARVFLEQHYLTADRKRRLMRWRDDWYVWTGTHWRVEDQASMTARVYAFLDAASVEEGKPFNPTEAKVRAVLHALEAEAYLDSRIEPPGWIVGDGSQKLVACRNGLLDISTGELRPHTPDWFNLSCLDFDFDPAATAPRHIKFLRSILLDDMEAISALLEIMGCILASETKYEKIFLIWGPPRCGKGTILKLLKSMLGADNFLTFTATRLGASFGMEEFPGKKLLALSDAHLDYMDRGRIAEGLKTISGRDEITISRKYKSAWRGTLEANVLIATNSMPRLDDPSGTIATRIVPIRLSISFLGRENLQLIDELKEELPGIFNQCLVAWQRLKARGHFIIPASAKGTVEALRIGANPLFGFLDEECKIGPDLTCDCDMLRGKFEEWRIRRGMSKPMSDPEFGRQLHSAVPGVTSGRGKRQPNGKPRSRYYKGIALLPEVVQQEADARRAAFHLVDEVADPGPEGGGDDDIAY